MFHGYVTRCGQGGVRGGLYDDFSVIMLGRGMGIKTFGVECGNSGAFNKMHVLVFSECAHGNDHALRTMSLIDVTVCIGVLAACCVVCIIHNGQVNTRGL